MTPTQTPANSPAFPLRPFLTQQNVSCYEESLSPLSDLVATQGQYLIPRPRTPVFSPLRSEMQAFATELTLQLSVLITHQNRRRLGYGVEAAEEWPIDRTPPEIKRACKERLRAKLRAALEEDSESDIEATLDKYYPLSPASPGSPSSRLAIDSKSAFPPLNNQIDSESDVRGEKRKHIEGESGHLSYTEHKRRKVADDDGSIIAGITANEGTTRNPDVESNKNSAESCGVTHAGCDGNGTVEKTFSEGGGPDSATAPISSPKTMDGSSLQRAAQRHSSPINSIP